MRNEVIIRSLFYLALHATRHSSVAMGKWTNGKSAQELSTAPARIDLLHAIQCLLGPLCRREQPEAPPSASAIEEVSLTEIRHCARVADDGHASIIGGHRTSAY
jgi:hypothetical protein